MTNDEAREILKRVEIAKPIKFEDYADMREALDMAIKALKQPPKTDVLEKIRAEIDQYLFQNEFGSEYRKEVSQIIDKYKAESEDEE